jgi:hypothetical protein
VTYWDGASYCQSVELPALHVKRREAAGVSARKIYANPLRIYYPLEPARGDIERCIGLHA